MIKSLSTGRYIISRGKMASALFQIYGKKGIAFSVLIVILLVISGCIIDIRLLIIGLMIGFILIPLMLAFLYFYYALTPVTSSNLLPHSVEIDDEGNVKLSLWIENDSSTTEGQPLWEISSVRLIPSRFIEKTITLLSEEAILFGNPHKGFILIKPTALQADKPQTISTNIS